MLPFTIGSTTNYRCAAALTSVDHINFANQLGAVAVGTGTTVALIDCGKGLASISSNITDAMIGNNPQIIGTLFYECT